MRQESSIYVDVMNKNRRHEETRYLADGAIVRELFPLENMATNIAILGFTEINVAGVATRKNQ